MESNPPDPCPGFLISIVALRNKPIAIKLGLEPDGYADWKASEVEAAAAKKANAQQARAEAAAAAAAVAVAEAAEQPALPVAWAVEA